MLSKMVRVRVVIDQSDKTWGTKDLSISAEQPPLDDQGPVKCVPAMYHSSIQARHITGTCKRLLALR